MGVFDFHFQVIIRSIFSRSSSNRWQHQNADDTDYQTLFKEFIFHIFIPPLQFYNTVLLYKRIAG